MGVHPLKYHICKIKCTWSIILYLYGLYHLQHKFSNYTELCFPIKWEGTEIDFYVYSPPIVQILINFIICIYYLYIYMYKLEIKYLSITDGSDGSLAAPGWAGPNTAPHDEDCLRCHPQLSGRRFVPVYIWMSLNFHLDLYIYIMTFRLDFYFLNRPVEPGFVKTDNRFWCYSMDFVCVANRCLLVSTVDSFWCVYLRRCAVILLRYLSKLFISVYIAWLSGWTFIKKNHLVWSGAYCTELDLCILIIL